MTVLANNGLKECFEEVSVFTWEVVNGHGCDIMKNEDVEMHPAGMVKHTENGCKWAVTPGISHCSFLSGEVRVYAGFWEKAAF